MQSKKTKVIPPGVKQKSSEREFMRDVRRGEHWSTIRTRTCFISAEKRHEDEMQKGVPRGKNHWSNHRLEQPKKKGKKF